MLGASMIKYRKSNISFFFFFFYCLFFLFFLKTSMLCVCVNTKTKNNYFQKKYSQNPIFMHFSLRMHVRSHFQPIKINQNLQNTISKTKQKHNSNAIGPLNNILINQSRNSKTQTNDQT